MQAFRRILLFLLLTLTALPAWGQGRRLLPVEDWAYTYISRLQRRGHLLELHPTALPYHRDQVAAALRDVDRSRLRPFEARWVDLLAAAFLPPPHQPDARRDDALDAAPARGADRVHLGALVEAGLRAADSDRLDPLRPLDSTSAPLTLGDARLFPNASLRLYAEHGPFVAAFGLRHDVYYDVDPDGIDAARRLYIRSEDAYVGYHARLVSATLGRFSNHWGAHGRAATLVSANPRAYDHLRLRVGGDRLALYALLGELDSITEDGRYTGKPADDTVRVGNRRRYLAAHRLDWRPSRRFNLSFQEAALYSGRNSNLSLKYLNPLHSIAFEIDNTPKNDENNGFLAGLLWFQHGPLTLEGQLLLDDLDIVGSTGERGSFAVTGSLLYALPAPADVGLLFELVTARAYNTGQPEGKYLYLNRGLGTQFNDYVHAALFADLYPARPLRGLLLTPRLDVLWQGEQDIRAAFPPYNHTVATVLGGTVARTVRASLQARYQPVPAFWIGLDGGLNVTANEGFVAGRRRTRFAGQLAFGVRVTTDTFTRLSFP